MRSRVYETEHGARSSHKCAWDVFTTRHTTSGFKMRTPERVTWRTMWWNVYNTYVPSLRLFDNVLSDEPPARTAIG